MHRPGTCTPLSCTAVQSLAATSLSLARGVRSDRDSSREIASESQALTQARSPRLTRSPPGLPVPEPFRASRGRVASLKSKFKPEFVPRSRCDHLMIIMMMIITRMASPHPASR